MTDTNQQVDHLKSHIDKGAKEAKSYLDKLKENVKEYDRKNEYSHKATDFMRSGIDAAEASVDELMQVGTQLTQKSKETSGKTMELAHGALQKVKTSLDAVQETARQYDEKFTGSMGAKAVDDVSSSVANIANSTRQRTTDAIEMASEQLTRMKDSAQNVASSASHGAQVTMGEAVRVGEKIDEKLGVSDKAAGAAGLVTGTVKSLDKRMHVTETAAAIDSKVTGGLGARVVHKGVEMVQESIEYVTDTLNQAKIAAKKSSTAQAVDEKATSAVEGVSSTAGAAQEKVMSAKDQTMGMASSAKDQAMEMAGMDTGRPATKQMKEGASNVKDQTMEKGSQMKEGAQEMAGSAQQKGSEMAGSAQQTGSQMKDKAMEKGSQVKEGAQEMADSAQQKGSEMAGSAQETGTQMKEGVKQGALSAKDKASETASSAKGKGGSMTQGAKNKMSQAADTTQDKGKQAGEQSQSTYETMKERVKEVGTGAKEAAFGMSSGESATDAKHKAEQRGGESEGTVTEAFVEIKDASGNIMSRSKGMMKDATKA